MGAQAAQACASFHSQNLCNGLILACGLLASCLAVPLWRTRRRWSRTLELLRGWRSGDAAQALEAPPPYDRRTRELVQLVRGGIQRELASRTADAERRAAAEMAGLADQMAHAIRSPLAALDTLTHQIPDEPGAVMRVAASRIEAIAADLVDRCAPPPPPMPPSPTPNALAAAQLLDNTLRTLRNETPPGGPLVRAHLEDSAHGAFVALPRAQLAALLRRLVSQALEATPPGGKVLVHAEADAQALAVSVCDNAATPRSAASLTALQQMTRAAGGKLDVLPSVPSGQRVVLHLPLQAQPPWYVPALRLQSDQRVVIADDDPSMHAAWRARLKAVPQLSLHHVHTPDGLRTWYSQHGDAQTLFLVDHDFRGHAVHGLALIQELRLAKRSVLVTSHGDDAALQARCAAIALPLLNKNRMHSVPIHAE